MTLTPIDRRRLEHAAQLIDEVRDVCESMDLQKSTAKLTLAAEKIRLTLAPETGDEPAGSIVELMDFHADLVEQSKDDARKAAAMLAAFDPFRVLGSCPAPAPQVDVIDGETA